MSVHTTRTLFFSRLAMPDLHPVKWRSEMAKNSSMTGDKLESDLRSIGKACFVKHFDLFVDSFLSNSEAAERLRRRAGYTANACYSRASKARRIIRDGWTEQALMDISASKRVPPEIAERARSLAEKLQSRLPGPCDNDKRS